MAEINKSQYDKDILAAFAERTVKRLWVIIILLIVMLGVMTYLYIDTITQYETYKVEQEVEALDGDAYVAGVGDVVYGENKAEDNSTSPESRR